MIVLASKSPRRRELMKRITTDFIVYDSNVDEDKFRVFPPIEACRMISYSKAMTARKEYPNDTIVAADTVVILNNEGINKPKDREDAFNILRKLSNKTHEVVTSLVVIKEGKITGNIVISQVTFNDLSDELINAYIESGSPLDKAGAYGIQDNDKFPIVKEYKGSYDNIVGFPVDEIKEVLESL